MAATAVLAGATSFAAIVQWERHVGRTLLDAAGMADAVVVHRHWRTDRDRVPRQDGARRQGSEGNQPHLLAATGHASGVVIGQVDVAVATNEIPCCASFSTSSILRPPLLRWTRHTQRAAIEHIVGRGGHVAMTVKKNKTGSHQGESGFAVAPSTGTYCHLSWVGPRLD